MNEKLMATVKITGTHEDGSKLALTRTTEQAPRTASLMRDCGYIPEFSEADCGGVFDGFGVVSDADPGL